MEPVAQTATPVHLTRPRFLRRARPYLILAPGLLLTIGILYPFAVAVYYSFTSYSLTWPVANWVGLENYRMVMSEPGFWRSVSVTLRYAFWTTLVETILGLALALVLNREGRFTRLLRTVMVFPLMIAPVIAAVIWKLMMQPSVGILNVILTPLGLPNFEWAAHPDYALMSVVLIDVWIFTPFFALLLLAGLQGMPKEPFEAAEVDGGSWWFTFKTLTVPMLLPYYWIALVFRLIDSLKMFDIIYAMTGGGPGDTLMTFSLQTYYNSLMYMQLGQGLTYMVMLWVVIYIISQILVNRWSHSQRRAAGL